MDHAVNEYRITKYDPAKRIDGVYTADEWTSISDIGKTFASGTLFYDRYKETENAYIDCCIALLRRSGISKLSVTHPEYYAADIRFPKCVSNEKDIRWIIMCCLQEKGWAKLESTDFFIHFGYDYYLYVGTNLSQSVVNEICKHHGLFCEAFQSPYG